MHRNTTHTHSKDVNNKCTSKCVCSTESFNTDTFGCTWYSVYFSIFTGCLLSKDHCVQSHASPVVLVLAVRKDWRLLWGWVRAGLCPLTPVLVLTFISRFSMCRLGVEASGLCLLLTKCVFLLASLCFMSHFQLSRKQFAAKYEAAGMKLSTSDCGPPPEKHGAPSPGQGWDPAPSGGVQLGVCLVNDGKMELEMVRWISAALAAMQTLLQPVTVKKQLSRNALDLPTDLRPAFTHAQGLWAVTDSMEAQTRGAYIRTPLHHTESGRVARASCLDAPRVPP